MVAQRAPALGDAGYSPGDPIAFVATTRFDVWGSTATTVDPPRAALGFEVPAGPNYGIVLLVSAVLLAGAALTTALPGRFGWSRLLALGAPVAGGALAGIAACQLLAFQATSRSSTADGADVVAAILRPEWRLGLSPWRTTPGHLSQAYARQAVPRRPVDPAIFRRPDHPGPTSPRRRDVPA